jgi:hypothetical protein
MNQLTKDIMAWLKVDEATAIRIQEEMMGSGVSFSNSSTATLKRLAKGFFNCPKGSIVTWPKDFSTVVKEKS